MTNSTLVEVFTDIANAIREKEGSSDVIAVSDMSDRIKSIETGGTGNAYSVVASANSNINVLSVTDSNFVDFYNNGSCYMTCTVDNASLPYTVGNIYSVFYNPDLSDIFKIRWVYVGSAAGYCYTGFDQSNNINDSFSVSSTGLLEITIPDKVFAKGIPYRITVIKK